MNAILIGDNVTSLALAKCLINNNVNVKLYLDKKSIKIDRTRTISISKKNLEFIQESILKISSKYLWDIENIEIAKEENQIIKILNFKGNKKEIFSIIKNYKLYDLLNLQLKKNKKFQRLIIKKKTSFFKNILSESNTSLIFNCDKNNEISRNYSKSNIQKHYLGKAYVTTIKHKKLKNNKALQIFTKKGPLAFLPTSNFSTSIVFSMIDSSNYSNKQIIDLINFYNNSYNISSFSEVKSFNLKFNLQKKYVHNNILLFGESIHQIHPLAGQGFNMTIRDIEEINNIIIKRKNLGLRIDSEIFKEFEKKVKHKNIVFASGIDYINSFFSKDSFIKQKVSKKLFNLINNNKIINEVTKKLADRGLNF